MKSTYQFDKENGMAKVIFTNKRGKHYLGYACCHEQDFDMMSEKTGLFIAEQRAIVDYLRGMRDTDIKPKLQILEHIYDGIQRSKHFNENSYENRILRRQIRFLKNDLTTVNENIAEIQKNLEEFIHEKDNFYKRVRANREKND